MVQDGWKVNDPLRVGQKCYPECYYDDWLWFVSSICRFEGFQSMTTTSFCLSRVVAAGFFAPWPSGTPTDLWRISQQFFSSYRRGWSGARRYTHHSTCWSRHVNYFFSLRGGQGCWGTFYGWLKCVLMSWMCCSIPGRHPPGGCVRREVGRVRYNTW